MKAVSISIIGGGIGGLATAAALLKKGFKVQVYERAQALRPVGAGLTLSPNGLSSLAAIEPKIVEALKQGGSEVQNLTMKRSSGEMIISKPIALAEPFGQPMLNIMWSRLQSILASVLPPDIIHLNHRCVAIEQHKSGVKAHFENGESVESDLLIAADGINSAVRQSLIGDGAPAYAGRMSWRAVIKFPHRDLIPNGSTGFTGPDGKNFMLFDMGEGYTCWSAGALLAEPLPSAPPNEVKDRVLKTFSGWADLVEGIVKATPAGDIVERTISDRPPLRCWSHGRVTLLGDAAHPVVPALGQGANITFEDAYEIAECLSSSPDIETALRSYEASRIPRTDAIYARSASQGVSSYKPDSHATLAETVARISEDEFQVWLYGYRPTPAQRASA
jgi:salicylate hydroxylase